MVALKRTNFNLYLEDEIITKIEKIAKIKDIKRTVFATHLIKLAFDVIENPKYANFNQAEFRAEYQGNKVEFAKIDELALKKVVGKIFTVIQVINRFILSKNNKYFYNGKKWAMLSAKKLGEFTGLSGRTVYRHLNKLQEMGIIIADKIFSLKNSKRNQTNFYTINYQKLEELGVPLYKKFSVTIDDF